MRQMMNVMLMAMMQNIGGSNQQQRTDIVGGLRTDFSGTNEQQNNENNK
jgi:Ni,Fe-hydrogenase III large subunit